jgi:hypothetical protein
MQVLQQLSGIRPQSPPKFLAQQGGISGGGFQPFVTGFNPVLGGNGTVGYQPVITTLLDGISLGVTAIVSADRRYVRLAVAPSFTTITGVDVFSFVGGLPQGGAGGTGGGQGAGGAGGGRVP